MRRGVQRVTYGEHEGRHTMKVRFGALFGPCADACRTHMRAHICLLSATDTHRINIDMPATSLERWAGRGGGAYIEGFAVSVTVSLDPGLQCVFDFSL